MVALSHYEAMREDSTCAMYYSIRAQLVRVAAVGATWKVRSGPWIRFIHWRERLGHCSAEHSPGSYSAASGFVTEVVMTFMFLIVILGATDKRVPAGFAPIAIGLGLTLIHLISIPVTNTSVNPARSTGPALLVGGWAVAQLWMFWVAPLIGAALAGVTYRWLGSEASRA